jgi:hypothetical protein
MSSAAGISLGDQGRRRSWMTEAPSAGFRRHVWLATISTCVLPTIGSLYS